MRKVKWGVIGAGGIADRRTLPGMMLAENCALTAVMEVNDEKSKALAAKYGAPYSYTSAEALLANPEIEAVYIASPVAFHKEQVIAAAGAHKHVLCEKPIALTYEDSVAAMQACRENNVLAASGFMMRFHSLHRKMKQLIEEGRLGQIVSCSLQMSCWFPFIEGSWRQQRKNAGGGALIDMGIHCIDLAEYLLGSPITAVTAFCDTKTFAYDIDDSSNIMLKTESGTVVYICNNYNVPDPAAASRIEIYGTGGSLVAEGTLGQTGTGTLQCVFAEEAGYDALQDRSVSVSQTVEADGSNPYTAELSSFARSVLTGEAPEVPMQAAVRAQRIVETAYRASENNRVCRLEMN